MTGSFPARPLTDHALWARVVRHARCGDGSLHPDEWFPVSAESGKARQEAAAAITICASCLARTQCLELSRRHWDISQHGIPGGPISADRAGLRRRLPADHSPRRKTAIVQGEGVVVPPRVLSRLVKAVTPSER